MIQIRLLDSKPLPWIEERPYDKDAVRNFLNCTRPCFLCWLEREAKLRELEQARWADDGGRVG